MQIGKKIFIRACSLLLYIVFFAGTYIGLHFFLASTATIQDQRVYSEENMPAYFPILVMDEQDADNETLALRSLGQAEYSGQSQVKTAAYRFYQQPGKAELTGTSGVSYQVTSLSPQRVQVEISIGEKNNQRTSVYTYDLEQHKATPKSYFLRSAFGHNFSPMPFLVIITAILIYLSEKFLVRRLLKSTS